MKFFKFGKKNKQAQAQAPADGAPVRNKYAEKDKRRKKLPRKVKIIIWVVILAALGTGIYFLINYLLHHNVAEEPQISTAYRGNLSVNINGWGTATPKQKSDITATSIGTVTEVRVKTGDKVKKGDVLFAVNPSEAKNKLAEAREKYESQKKTVDSIKKSIDNLTVEAPFAGRLLNSADFKGLTEISQGSELCRIVDDSQMKLKLLFNYAYVAQIKAGMSATVSVPSSMTSVKGSVLSVSDVEITGDEGGIYFEVYVSFDNPKTLTENTAATAVIHGDSRDYYPYDNGTLEYLQSEQLTAKSGGDIISNLIKDGYRCTDGQTLLKLENDSLTSSLESESRTLSELSDEVTKLQKSVDSSVSTSPIDGVVTTVAIEEGDEITSVGGTTLVSVSDMSKMIVKGEIDEANIDKVSVGTPVRISVYQTDGEVSLSGVVQNISFEASTSNGGNVAFFPVEIMIEKNDVVMPGMGVNFTIDVLMRSNCIIVPTQAIEYTDDGVAVFVRKETAGNYEKIIEVNSDTVPEGFCAVPVTIGISDANGTEIISGIEEGTEVYVRQSMPNYGGGGIMGGIALG